MIRLNALAHEVREIRFLAGLRRFTLEEMLRQYGAQTRALFAAAQAEAPIITVVPAHQEGYDIAACLYSIARAGSLAIVVSNNSTDGTQEIARAMGAEVIEANNGRKMGATQAGIAHAVEKYDARRLLFTDADTLVPDTWASTMDGALQAMDKGAGAMACGDSVVWHGKAGADPGNRVAHMLYNSVVLRNALKRSFSNPPYGIARGHNYGLSLDKDGGVAAAIGGLPADRFVEPGKAADDTLIAETLRAREGTVVQGVLDAGAWVLTRGDRLTNTAAALAVFLRLQDYNQATAAAYRQQFEAEAEAALVGAHSAKGH